MKFDLSRLRETVLELSQEELAKLMTLELSELIDLENHKSLNAKHIRKIMEASGLFFEEIAFFDRETVPVSLVIEPM